MIFDAATNSLQLSSEEAEQRLTGANEHLASLNDLLVKRYLANRSQRAIVKRARVAASLSLYSESKPGNPHT